MGKAAQTREKRERRMMQRTTLMSANGKTISMLGMALLILSVSACSKPSQTGTASARIDAVQADVTRCAEALTGGSMPAAREFCLPVLVRISE
jgi:zona occludens toxin (predicted ATPase)